MATIVRNVDLKRNTTNRKIIFWLFFFTGIISFGLWLYGRKSGGEIFDPYKVSFKVEGKNLNTNTDNSRSTTELVTKLKQMAANTSGSYGIYVYRLNEDKGYGFNQNQIFPAASIMKVPIMASVFVKIENGGMNLTDGYNLSSSDIRTGSGPIEFMNPGTNLTVDYMLKVMGQNSDNTAPVILTKLVGQSNVEKTITDLGMNNTSFDDNTTTAVDLTMMWKNLYQDKIVSRESQEKMWEYLQDSIYEDRIALGIPKDVTLIHKVGSDADIWADAGIVSAPQPFVIVILNDNVDLDEAKILVPKLTAAIWEYEAGRVGSSSPQPSKSQ